ncbi:hypothetical protein GCM10011416_02210 [Polaribacter pacificus]|uniref:AB hydrolase-1 domain-containing protein n=1 Tax=Polaribacter pacificus TaxID=1775173 RepID=A0A917MBB0_9FLAO|nr:alpha/beta hydrolase [Polaribacter pacificus]GGG89372.1 hypothetical protein GCM10011416_02210 [Polaribacter pacificus]
MRTSTKSIVKDFEKNGMTPIVKTIAFEGNTLRYLISDVFDEEKPTILFVHGAPGSLSDFNSYLQDTVLREQANLIAIDRLGYGFSSFGKAEVLVSKQAKSIEKLTDLFDKKTTILVGWSFGGTIVGEIGIRNKYYHTIMVAPAVSPEAEKHFWLGNFAHWRLTKWMVPKAFVVAEAEKRMHVEELQRLDPLWQQTKTPITYYHGTDDWIVPFENQAYLKSKMPKKMLETVTIEGGSHFILFKNFTMVQEKLLSLIALINAEKNEL